jgi:hypothetical protein
MSALQHAFILGSHAFYIPTVALALRLRLAMDVVIFLRVTINSLIYHASDAGLEPFGDSHTLQSVDNQTVWTALLWLYISSLGVNFKGSVVIWVSVMTLFEIFPRLLVDTFVFQLAFVPTALLVQGACVLLFEMPLPRYNLAALAIGVVVFAAGLPFLYFEPYYTLHGFWHVLSGVGGFFIYCGLRNLSLRPPFNPRDEVKSEKKLYFFL